MTKPSCVQIERLLEKTIIPLFELPEGNVAWQGHSELDIERDVSYFAINKINYLLVNEPHHGVNESRLTNLLAENAVAPHEKIVFVSPKSTTRSYVHVSDKSILPLKGDFSIFRIET